MSNLRWQTGVPLKDGVYVLRFIHDANYLAHGFKFQVDCYYSMIRVINGHIVDRYGTDKFDLGEVDAWVRIE